MTFRPLLHLPALFILATISLLSFLDPDLKIRVPDNQLQKQINAQLPLERVAGPATVRIEDLQIEALSSGQLKVDVSTDISGLPQPAQAEITVLFEMDLRDRALFLRNIDVVETLVSYEGLEAGSFQKRMLESMLSGLVDTASSDLSEKPAITSDDLPWPAELAFDVTRRLDMEEGEIVIVLSLGKMMSSFWHILVLFCGLLMFFAALLDRQFSRHARYAPSLGVEK